MRAFSVASTVVLALSASPAVAAPDPAAPGPVEGTVTIHAKAAAVGIGYSWGDGVLRFHGHSYHFGVKGITIADVGYASVIGHGRVYKLAALKDFSGTYAASTGEVTAGKGIGGEILQNGNGVQIRIDEVTKGARLTGAADGIQLTLR